MTSDSSSDVHSFMCGQNIQNLFTLRQDIMSCTHGSGGEAVSTEAAFELNRDHRSRHRYVFLSFLSDEVGWKIDLHQSRSFRNQSPLAKRNGPDTVRVSAIGDLNVGAGGSQGTDTFRIVVFCV